MNNSSLDHEPSRQDSDRAPKISIGLPVYNGARFLPMAVESILRQTFLDFELILCDNASTDSTPDLCKGWAEKDPRIRYIRNPRNVGGAANFNKTVALARGQYFKWASDDDVCSETFLEVCNEVLDKDPSAVMAYPKISSIDENGTVRGRPYREVRGDLPRPSQRFAAILGPNARGCQGIFGLMRIEALRRTPLLQGWWASDRNVLARLALMGRLVEVEGAEFYFRSHSGRSVCEYPTPQAHSVWFDPSLEGKPVYPRWRLARDYMAAIQGAQIPLTEKIACWRVLSTSFRWMMIGKDLMVAVSEIGRAKSSQRKVPSEVRSASH